MGSSDAKQFNISGEDEMALLSKAFNRMRRSLEHAIMMLGEGDESAADRADGTAAR
jgi:nitrate/nitrite-specific signal transduction histidine kinase